MIVDAFCWNADSAFCFVICLWKLKQTNKWPRRARTEGELQGGGGLREILLSRDLIGKFYLIDVINKIKHL